MTLLELKPHKFSTFLWGLRCISQNYKSKLIGHYDLAVGTVAVTSPAWFLPRQWYVVLSTRLEAEPGAIMRESFLGIPLAFMTV